MATRFVNVLGVGVLMVLLGLGASTGTKAQDKSCMTNSQGNMVCPAADSTCLKNRYGDIVCSTPGGGIALDRYGEPSCGPGSCTRDVRGDLFCSSSPRGAAATNATGDAVCSGQCVPAQPKACVKL
jgi:hypothetical protein